MQTVHENNCSPNAGLSSENHRASTMEAAMEKQQLEFDVEREQMRARLAREQNRTTELQKQLQQLQEQQADRLLHSGGDMRTHQVCNLLEIWTILLRGHPTLKIQSAVTFLIITIT